MKSKSGWRAFRYISLALVAGLYGGLSVNDPAYAQDNNYPRRAITLIVPYGAGGLPDMMSRILQGPLERQLGQRIIIENRVGGGGLVGTQVGMAAKPDGYTIIWETVTSAILNQLTKKSPQFDLRKLVPITEIAYWPNIVILSKTVEQNNVKDYLDLLKANPGKYKINISAVGSVGDLLARLFMQRTGTNMLIVPYSTGGDASLSMGNGETHMNVGAADALTSPSTKALCTIAKERSTSLPDTPTCEEAGIANYSLANWAGLYGPPGMPAAITQKIAKSVQAVLKDSDVQKRFNELVLVSVGSNPEEFRKVWEHDWIEWQEVIKATGFQAQ